MPLTPNFSSSQALSALRTLTLADTSTGSDGTITTRRIYIAKFDGTYLVPSGTLTSYVAWSYSDASISIANIIDQNYALSILVQWLAGSSVVYTKTILCRFKGHAVSFLIDLSRFQASNPSLVDSKNYFESKSKLRELVDDADNAVTYGNDQTTAQLCLSEATQLINKQVLFF